MTIDCFLILRRENGDLELRVDMRELDDFFFLAGVENVDGSGRLDRSGKVDKFPFGLGEEGGLGR